MEEFNEGYDTERSEDSNVKNKLGKSSFIISPADIEVHQKAALKSDEISAENLEAFEQLCDKYKDVFSVDFFDFAFGYLGDILIYSPDMSTHLKHLQMIFQRLKETQLKLKIDKCNFLNKHIQYLGHMISGAGIVPVPEKLESVEQMPPPTTPREVKQFLGLVGYYRKFVPKFADLARPLNILTRKDVEFEWTEICQQSFELLKSKLLEAPILQYPYPK